MILARWVSTVLTRFPTPQRSPYWIFLGQEADDFNLARSCSSGHPVPSLMLVVSVEKSVKHNFGYFRGEETLTSSNGFHRFR